MKFSASLTILYLKVYTKKFLVCVLVETSKLMDVKLPLILKMLNMDINLQCVFGLTVYMYPEVRQYLLSKDWVGLKWCLVLKVWEYLQDKHSEEMQNSYRLKTLAILM